MEDKKKLLSNQGCHLKFFQNNALKVQEKIDRRFNVQKFNESEEKYSEYLAKLDPQVVKYKKVVEQKRKEKIQAHIDECKKCQDCLTLFGKTD